MDEGLIHLETVEMLVSLKILTRKDPVDLRGLYNHVSDLQEIDIPGLRTTNSRVSPSQFGVYIAGIC